VQTRLPVLSALALLLVLLPGAAARSGPPLLCFPLEQPPGTKLPFAVDDEPPLDVLRAEVAGVLAESDAAEVHQEVLRRAVLVLQGRETDLAVLLDDLRAARARAVRAEALLDDADLAQPAVRRGLALAHLDLALGLAAAAEAGHRAADLSDAVELAGAAVARRPDDGALLLGASLVALSTRAERASWEWLDGALKHAEQGSRLARNVVATQGVIHGGRELDALAQLTRARVGV